MLHAGHDLDSLLFNWLDCLLFRFASEFFICKRVRIVMYDAARFRIRAHAWGEIWDEGKHEQGTEIKAITYSNMQIFQTPQRTDVYVIVDI
jgi:SHS2 domain-containing protein